MPANHIVYLELPARDTAGLKAFYGRVFDWTFEDFGPAYATFSRAGMEGGFNADPSRSRAPLAVIETDAIEAMEARVRATGGQITAPIFAFPGGRRFHFTDPSGNELAVMQPDAPAAA